MEITAQHTAKCLACGRVRHFRSAESAAKAAPNGRVCAAKIRKAAIETALTGFTPAQQAKALELIADGGLVPLKRAGAWKAVGSDGVTFYLVAPQACNCPGGLHGRTCYHIAAARVLAATAQKAA